MNSLLCWSLTLLMFIQTLYSLQPAGRYICDVGNFFSGLAKSPHVRASIVLNIEWVEFLFQNCEILHSVWGLYDKNSAS